MIWQNADFRPNSTGSSDYRRHSPLALMTEYTSKGIYHPFAPTLTSSPWNQMFTESVDLLVCVAMVYRGENKDWIGPWMTFCELPTITVAMSFCMHSLLFRYLDCNHSDDANRRNLRHLDWFKLKMIMAFSFNKLCPRIPLLPPKTQFVKIKFINQDVDLLNISNTFRDHRVTSKIPQYFENLDPPLICYHYKKTIRTIIFN